MLKLNDRPEYGPETSPQHFFSVPDHQREFRQKQGRYLYQITQYVYYQSIAVITLLRLKIINSLSTLAAFNQHILVVCLATKNNYYPNVPARVVSFGTAN